MACALKMQPVISVNKGCCSHHCVVCVLVAKSCSTLVIPWTMPARLLCSWDSPCKCTGVGCYFLLQGIFPTQESNPGLLHCRSYEGSPKYYITAA